MNFAPMSFDYDQFTTRNIGFVTADEQARLRGAAVFVAGVGGMGGACLASLARAGVGRLGLADIDRFELSNLNRQVFADLDSVGALKTTVAAEAVRRINPEVELEVLDAAWMARLDDIAKRYAVIVNGCDDVAATVALYRAARAHGATVIDAYAAPLPSVTVVRPHAPRPEDRLAFPTRGKAWEAITPDEARGAFLKELEYVLTHSSSARHIDLRVAAEVAAGKRPRMSFAPPVIVTGNLMAQEALQAAMGRTSRTDHKGWFFNPYRARVERPTPQPFAAARRALVRRFMHRMLEAS